MNAVIFVLVCVLPVAKRQPIVGSIAAPRTVHVCALFARSRQILRTVLVTTVIIVDALFLEGDIYEELWRKRREEGRRKEASR